MPSDAMTPNAEGGRSDGGAGAAAGPGAGPGRGAAGLLASWRGSLRARLLSLLLAVVVLAAGVQAALAYRSALAEADSLFDYHMRQTALSLRAGLPPPGTPGATPAPPLPAGAPEVLDYVVQVWSLNGLRLYGSDALAALPQRAVLGFSNARAANGAEYRVFSVQTPLQVVQVAQDLAIRRRMATALAWRTVAPIGLALPVLALALWWGVGRALRPVQRVRAQLGQRRPDDLAPVDAAGLPDEVAPLVHGLNALLQRVRQAFDAQQAFVADAAHELRSPLAALRLQAQALQRAPDDEARQRAGQRLLAGIDRAARLVDQLLVLAREEAQATAADTAVDADGMGPAGRGRPAALPAAEGLQPVRLDTLARQALADAAADASARDQALALVQADPVAVRGRPDALAIALRNLVDNALKYSPPAGQVQVAVCAGPDGSATLQVDDSGPGIPSDQRAAALARFKRLDPASAAAAGAHPAPGGSGLGLAIVHTIARHHGAQLQLAQSPALGGLRAVLRFPATAAVQATAQA